MRTGHVIRAKNNINNNKLTAATKNLTKPNQNKTKLDQNKPNQNKISIKNHWQGYVLYASVLQTVLLRDYTNAL